MNPLIQRIADLAGLQVALQIEAELGGKAVYIPKPIDDISLALHVDYIAIHFDGNNEAELAQKLGLSQVAVLEIIRKLRVDKLKRQQMRIVSPKLTVHINGAEYDVSGVPGIAVGEVFHLDPANLPPLFTRERALMGFAQTSETITGRGMPPRQPASDRQDEAGPAEPCIDHPLSAHLHECAALLAAAADQLRLAAAAGTTTPGMPGQAPQSGSPMR